ncbi:hypothetical protein LR48_Vigan09g008400 [Vigna angularis]|uniref:Uncharacterized protein n=1 Tax=Phaseolus angularis TaxID=3914 RepID=A0A0L9V8L1_PHAAN|nr:hypothetical protein LR48_Vigan09g008400 [Vigna angularis]
MMRESNHTKGKHKSANGQWPPPIATKMAVVLQRGKLSVTWRRTGVVATEAPSGAMLSSPMEASVVVVGDSTSSASGEGYDSHIGRRKKGEHMRKKKPHYEEGNVRGECRRRLVWPRAGDKSRGNYEQFF